MNKIKQAFDTIKAEDSIKSDTIEFLKNRTKKHNKLKYIYRYAAVLSFIIAIFAGVKGYMILNTVSSYISIDINPSVELALNRFDNVVYAAAYNDDGEFVLDGLNLKGKSYIDAIDMLISDEKFLSYINENNRIDFTVVSDNKDEIIKEIENTENYKIYNGSCHSADSETLQEAHRHGMSVGKYCEYSEPNSSDVSEICKDTQAEQNNENAVREDGSGEQNIQHHAGGQHHQRHRKH